MNNWVVNVMSDRSKVVKPTMFGTFHIGDEVRASLHLYTNASRDELLTSFRGYGRLRRSTRTSLVR